MQALSRELSTFIHNKPHWYPGFTPTVVQMKKHSGVLLIVSILAAGIFASVLFYPALPLALSTKAIIGGSVTAGIAVLALLAYRESKNIDQGMAWVAKNKNEKNAREANAATENFFQSPGNRTKISKATGQVINALGGQEAFKNIPELDAESVYLSGVCGRPRLKRDVQLSAPVMRGSIPHPKVENQRVEFVLFNIASKEIVDTRAGPRNLKGSFFIYQELFHKHSCEWIQDDHCTNLFSYSSDERLDVDGFRPYYITKVDAENSENRPTLQILSELVNGTHAKYELDTPKE